MINQPNKKFTPQICPDCNGRNPYFLVLKYRLKHQIKIMRSLWKLSIFRIFFATALSDHRVTKITLFRKLSLLLQSQIRGQFKLTKEQFADSVWKKTSGFKQNSKAGGKEGL